MGENKAELKMAEEEQEDEEPEIEEKPKKKTKKERQEQESEETEEISLDNILANHEERLQAIESFIFRLKNL